ncbi:MAG: hypothetical protein NTU63_00345 [Candidatus Pacearchaeota archaeon]|nr:hypothetical protein [Candidatus Pacearchaeota archaeon]
MNTKRGKIVFTFLSIVVIVALGLTVYSVYLENYVNSFLFLVVGILPLGYLAIRNIRKKGKKKRK